MKKLFVIIFAISAGLFYSCSKEDALDNTETADGKVFKATTEPATKTALEQEGDAYNVVWQNGDQITIVDGATTPNVGVYSTTSTTTHADFTFSSGSEATTPVYKAYYPATVYSNGTPTLPTTQNYAAGNIAGAPMYAESPTENLTFKNICGIIRLNVSTSLSGKKVRKIVLYADQGMSGAISNAATLASNSYVAAVTSNSGVTLDCGSEGVDIGSTAVPFHIAVPQNSYSSLSIKVVTTDNCIQTRTLKTGKTVSVQRSGITTINISFNDLAPMPDAVDLSETECANTYIVSSVGYYKFNATVKGNGGLDPLTGTTATTINPSTIAGVKVLWELYGQGRAIKYNGAYDISYSDGYVYFSTPDTFVPGDVCVAVYDASDNILWSWVIWATPEPGEKIHNGSVFMDRNYGAIDVGNCMRGFLFQWGRKDAFSAANGGYDVYPYVPVAANVFNWVYGLQSMEYTIAHPTTWIRYPSGASNGNWTSDNLSAKPWRADVKTIYDPCPQGWRIPTKDEISDISGLPNTGIGGGYDPNDYYKGFGNPGTGYYWTASTDDGNDDRAYAFCNDGRNIKHWSQGEGYAIRPVRDVVVPEEVTVYDGTATSSYVPVYGYYGDAYLKCEYIMPATALTSMNGLTVKSMTFYLNTSASGAWTGTFQVFMKEVDYTSISEYSGTADATVVYAGTLDARGSTMTINFTTPYTYNGGNLLIGVYQTEKGSYYSAVFSGQEVTGASVQGHNGSSLASASCVQRNFLPKTTFGF
ncbi:MAG: DUF1566 domain-containing protein [Bacteroidales bacterium]|nr:DUF1566 domain-containing protein [Bacteroidales bacterium]